jgi:hypothetical protein
MKATQLCSVLVFVVVTASFVVSAAQTPALVERANEVRFQLDFKVSDAALAAVMPKGFAPDVATTGPAKDCNVRVIFIDRVTINGPNNAGIGKGTSQIAFVVAPVKDPAGQSTQLVITGLVADPADAPGPFGNYLATQTHTMRRTTAPPTGVGGPQVESQDWVFAAATGEHLELHVQYERGIANYRPTYERKYYSAKDPTKFQIAHEELVLDILKNVTTTPPDRVKSFSFNGGGGSLAKMFDGTEKVLSWDNILWMVRTVDAS